MRCWVTLIVSSLLPLSPLSAQAPSKPVEFERDVRPILEARCVSCHGPKKQRGGLRLDSGPALFQGGDSGAILVPGKATESGLLRRVISADESERMPPTGERLSPAQVALVRAWIDQGAKTTGPKTVAAETHWAFQPLRPIVPEIRDATSPLRNAIDSFLLAKLRGKGLDFSPEADRATLIRRLSFDLIGLPPTPEEVDAFVADARPDAYERLVERLLASPHFGERWGRHWLDVVRFAESHGFEMNQPRPTAWRYRDWVIRAFNRDMPYDRFVQAQLAGDALGEDEATGFLVAGPWDQVKSPDPVLTANQRADELHDMIGTTGSAFLGLTVACARCHAHKFDPIPQADYYAIKAVLDGVQHGERALPVAPLVGEPRRRPAVQTGANREDFEPTPARFLRFTVLGTSDAEPCLDELEAFTADGVNVALASVGTKATASGSYVGNPFHRLEHVIDGRYGNQQSWISNQRGKGWVRLEFPNEVQLVRVVWSRDRTEPPRYRDRLATRYRIEVSRDGKDWQAVASGADRESGSVNSASMAYLGRFTQPGPTRRFHRGDPTQPREAIAPSVLTGIGPRQAIPADAPERQRRLALARWITSPDNPLTARVIVNRLWQHHFGTGIVETPSDFGKNGGQPSHPELLDWLANELVRSGWSLKHVHRAIVLSAAYRQSSRSRAEGQAVDAGDRLLWRYPPQRREAEALRDAILETTGLLDRRMGGAGFILFEPNTNYVRVYKPKETFGPAEYRRMVYWSKPRMHLDDTFGAFDCPDGGQIAPRRNVSTTALQALNLLNSPFLIQQSKAFAERVRREVGDMPVSQIRRAFRLAFQRGPTSLEEAGALTLVREHGLESLCRALLNANEFVYVE